MTISWMIVLGIFAVVFLLIERQRDKDQKDWNEWQKKRQEDYMKRSLDKLKEKE